MSVSPGLPCGSWSFHTCEVPSKPPGCVWWWASDSPPTIPCGSLPQPTRRAERERMRPNTVQLNDTCYMWILWPTNRKLLNIYIHLFLSHTSFWYVFSWVFFHRSHWMSSLLSSVAAAPRHREKSRTLPNIRPVDTHRHTGSTWDDIFHESAAVAVHNYSCKL